MPRPRRTATCPHCGESFPAGRLACPECGSDARTGWQSEEEVDYQSVDIPDFYPESAPAPAPRRSRITVLVVVFLVLALAGVISALRVLARR